MFRNRRILSFLLAFMFVLSVMVPGISFAEEENIKITILGTTDLHGNIYNWSYEDAKEVEALGLAKVYSIVKEVREENPNTILIDNGDTIQGTILTDDLYNTDLTLKNPIIDVMNFMKYDAMTLGNHEFNFGLEMVDKIVEEADFPLLGANIKLKEDGSYLTEPYTIIEIGGLKVGIIGFTNPNIPKWDGPKVTSLEFEDFLTAAEEPMKELNEKADIIIASSHSSYTDGYTEDEGYINDDAKVLLEKYPEIKALMVGHSHATVEEEFQGAVIGGARDAGRQVVRFDLEISKDGDTYTVEDSKVQIIAVDEYVASEDLKEYAKEYHEKTLEFLVEVLGKASADFAPKSEIMGIPEAQLRDTAVIDLINNVQLEATGADVAGAALFSQNSNLEAGDLNYADIFDIYKYPNTLVGVEVTGEQLKQYMEWSANYYNQYKEGDITLSFDPEIRGYNYDMFQGVDYKVDVSKPKGQRIVDLMFEGQEVKDDQVLKLAVNNYRYGGLSGMGIITETPYFESDPKSLRSYIADKIREEGTIDPVVDNNWEVIGADLDHPLRDYVIGEINAGNMELPKSEDGRTYNTAALNIDQLIANRQIPEEVLEEYGLLDEVVVPVEPETPVEAEEPVEPQEPVEEETPVTPEAQTKYVVKKGDTLWAIGRMFQTTWQKLADYNNLKNPHLIHPGQIIMIK